MLSSFKDLHVTFQTFVNSKCQFSYQAEVHISACVEALRMSCNHEFVS